MRGPDLGGIHRRFGSPRLWGCNAGSNKFKKKESRSIEGEEKMMQGLQRRRPSAQKKKKKRQTKRKRQREKDLTVLSE